MEGLADIISAPGWKHIEGENTLATLERAHKQYRRGATREAAHKATGERLDATLRSIADRRYGGDAA